MRAELCECEFMRAKLGMANVNFTKAEHCESEFYDS